MKHLKLPKTLTLSVMTLLSSATFAQPGEGDMPMGHGNMHGMNGMGMGMMSNMDANGDEAISRQEFVRAHEKMFTKMDEDGNGSISQDEMTQNRSGMMDGCMMGK